jgi:hypothetical protein
MGSGKKQKTGSESALEAARKNKGKKNGKSKKR